MIAYTGRLGFTQFNPNKPIRRGIKVWMRADPHNGFVDDFQIYTGRENNVREIGLHSRIYSRMALMHVVLYERIAGVYHMP